MMVTFVGILNLTPDSFSDGGHFTSADLALRHAEALIEAGAGVIDIGAESTRPHATPLSREEEWARLAPVLPALKACTKKAGVILSIDTRHAATAKQAIEMGADWINDVSGCDDTGMRKLIAGSAVSVVVMHHLGIPADPSHTIAKECDVIDAIISWAQEKITVLEAEGIAKERIIIDPGIGFGKTAQQSWEIIRHIASFRALGVRLLVGHSRKSFLSRVTAIPAEDRDIETYAVSSYLAHEHVDYLRVHDVAGNRRSVQAIEMIQS